MHLILFKFNIILCFKAWSSIVKPSIPNIEMFDTNLRMFFDKTECEEVALFEISTVLLLFTCGRSTHSNTNIFQKVFNILKTYKNNNKLVLSLVL